jgi:hypothetical protein
VVSFNHGERTILVQTKLSTTAVHAMMSLSIPSKVPEALLKICRAFLWKGRCDVNGGHCLVAWDKVASPKCNGGLELPNLRLLNLVLRCRWAWIQWVYPTQAWSEFNIQIPEQSRSFRVGYLRGFGNGKRAWCWRNLWLNAAWLTDIAPNLIVLISSSQHVGPMLVR